MAALANFERKIKHRLDEKHPGRANSDYSYGLETLILSQTCRGRSYPACVNQKNPKRKARTKQPHMSWEVRTQHGRGARKNSVAVRGRAERRKPAGDSASATVVNRRC